jgi:hypothetical protein
MARILEFFRQAATPTLADVREVLELQESILRFQALVQEARLASEELRSKRFGTFE